MKYSARALDLPRRDKGFDNKQDALHWLKRESLNGVVLERRAYGDYFTIALLKNGLVEDPIAPRLIPFEGPAEASEPVIWEVAQ